MPKLPIKTVRDQLYMIARSGTFVRALLIFLVADAVLVFLHILYELHDMEVIGGGSFLESKLLLISEDHGLGEFLNYAKSLLVAAMFFVCYKRTEAPIFGALGVTFIVIVLDDGLRLHEFFGFQLSSRLAMAPAFGLRAQDIGELIIWLLLGAFLVPILAVGFWYSNFRARCLASVYFCLLGLLAAFAVVFDMLSIILRGTFRGMHRIAPLVEDGGEMVSLSVICATALAATKRIESLMRSTG